MPKLSRLDEVVNQDQFSSLVSLWERYWRIVLLVEDRSCCAHQGGSHLGFYFYLIFSSWQGPVGRLLSTVAITCRLPSATEAISCSWGRGPARVATYYLVRLGLWFALRFGPCLELCSVAGAMYCYDMSQTADIFYSHIQSLSGHERRKMV